MDGPSQKAIERNKQATVYEHVVRQLQQMIDRLHRGETVDDAAAASHKIEILSWMAFHCRGRVYGIEEFEDLFDLPRDTGSFYVWWLEPHWSDFRPANPKQWYEMNVWDAIEWVASHAVAIRE